MSKTERLTIKPNNYGYQHTVQKVIKMYFPDANIKRLTNFAVNNAQREAFVEAIWSDKEI